MTKIAITCIDKNLDAQTDLRFGRTNFFTIYNVDDSSCEFVDNKQNAESFQGAGIQSAQTVAENNANVVITGHCGPKAFRTLSLAGIEIYLAEQDTVRNVIEKFKKGELKKIDSSDVEGHW